MLFNLQITVYQYFHFYWDITMKKEIKTPLLYRGQDNQKSCLAASAWWVGMYMCRGAIISPSPAPFAETAQMNHPTSLWLVGVVLCHFVLLLHRWNQPATLWAGAHRCGCGPPPPSLPPLPLLSLSPPPPLVLCISTCDPPCEPLLAGCHNCDFHTQTFRIFDISYPKSIHIGHPAHSFQWASQSYSHIMTINVSQTNITTHNSFHAFITAAKSYGYNQCLDILHSYCLTYYIGTPPHLLV
jgi:hypothetical protein